MYVSGFCPEEIFCIIGGSCHKSRLLSQQKDAWLLLRQTYFLLWQIFVMTNIILAWQTFFMTSLLLSQQTHVFVTKHIVCHGKSMLVMTNIVLSQQNSVCGNNKIVTTNIILLQQKFCCGKHTCDKRCVLSWPKWYLWQLLPMIPLSHSTFCNQTCYSILTTMVTDGGY